MTDYTGLTEAEASAKRLGDRGALWKCCDDLDGLGYDLGAHDLRQALHDRDRYHRDAAYWQEECTAMTAEALR